MKVEPEVDRSVARISSPPDLSSSTVHSLVRHSVSIALIVVAIIVLFWRVFFLGETLIDVATLDNQLPWGYYAGQSDYPYNRRDLTDTYVTRDYFVASAYRNGEFPLWNPYTMAGHPIYADGVTRTLSPFLLFYKFFDVPLGYSLARIAELMLAAVFMYIFLAAVGVSASGAFLGSLVFAFSAHSMLHLTGLGWWGGLMWLPLIILFVDRAIRRSSYAQAMLAGVCLAAQFFCGYLPNQIYYTGAVVLYYLFFALRRTDEGESRRRPRIFAMMVLTLLIGFALSATQWVPALELLSNSNRRIVGAELGYVYLPPWYAATLVFPNLFGTAYDAKILTMFTGLGVSHDHILYLGIAALAPLGFSLYWLWRTGKKPRDQSDGRDEGDGRDGSDRECLGQRIARDYIVFFAVLAAISLVIMMAAPLYVPITRHIPVLQVIRVAVRAGVLFLFAAAALVAFGADLLLESGSELISRFTRVARRFAVWAAALVLLTVAASYLMKLTGFAVDAGERGRVAFLRRAAQAIGAQFTPPNLDVLVPLGFLFLTFSLLWLLGKRRLARERFLLCLSVLLLVDLFWAGAQFNHSFDRSRVFPRTEITDLLRSLPPGRVLVVPSELETNRRVNQDNAEKIIAPPNTLLPYQIATVTGKNQQFPKWYREFASLIEPQNNLSHVVFDQYRSPFFDLLNVRYVMTHDSTPLPGCDLLAAREGISIYENNNAMPRPFFVSKVIDASSHEKAIHVLQSTHFNRRSTAVVENAGPSFAALLQQVDELGAANNTPSPGSARITEDKRDHVVIETDNQNPEALVLSDNYYPGWRAFVDGSPSPIFRANCTMRAVSVPAGHHVVSFVFMPPAFFLSMYISLAAAVLTLIILSLSVIKRKRE